MNIAGGQRQGTEIIKTMSKFEALREEKRQVILSVWGRRENLFKIFFLRDENISYYDINKTAFQCIWKMDIFFSSLSQIQNKTKKGNFVFAVD